MESGELVMSEISEESVDGEPEFDEKIRREQLYDASLKESWRRCLSNSTLFDKTLLIVSGAGLFMLMAIGQWGDGTDSVFCDLTAILFLIGHIAILVSFQTSQRTLKCYETMIHSYYICKNNEALNEKNHWDSATYVVVPFYFCTLRYRRAVPF